MIVNLIKRLITLYKVKANHLNSGGGKKLYRS